MEPIKSFFEIDWRVFGVTAFTVLFFVQISIKLFQWFVFDWLGIETKSMRERREGHELLISTAKGLQELSEKHSEDVKQSIAHDKKIQNNLNDFIDEIRSSIAENKNAIKQFSDNRVHDRKQSLEIQRELTESMNAIVKSGEARDVQIQNLITSQREALADRINQKYKHYSSKNGIPEDEVDEFISLHSAYKSVGGNHLGDAKFDYCINHLPIIPVDVKLDVK